MSDTTTVVVSQDQTAITVATDVTNIQIGVYGEATVITFGSAIEYAGHDPNALPLAGGVMVGPVGSQPAANSSVVAYIKQAGDPNNRYTQYGNGATVVSNPLLSPFVGNHVNGAVGNGSDTQHYFEQIMDRSAIMELQFARQTLKQGSNEAHLTAFVSWPVPQTTTTGTTASAGTTTAAKCTLTATTVAAGTSLIVDSTSGFPATGSLVLNGVTYTYSGMTATTFTGISPPLPNAILPWGYYVTGNVVGTTQLQVASTAGMPASGSFRLSGATYTYSSLDATNLYGLSPALPSTFGDGVAVTVNFTGFPSLQVASTAGFSSSGSINVSGTTYTYTSISATAFLGISGNLVAPASGAVTANFLGSAVLQVASTAQFAASGSVTIGVNTFSYTSKDSTHFLGVNLTSAQTVGAAVQSNNGSADPGSTITVNDTTGFAAAGVLVATIGTPGTQQVGAVTYTGKTSTTFTGCTSAGLSVPTDATARGAVTVRDAFDAPIERTGNYNGKLITDQIAAQNGIAADSTTLKMGPAIYAARTIWSFIFGADTPAAGDLVDATAGLRMYRTGVRLMACTATKLTVDPFGQVVVTGAVGPNSEGGIAAGTDTKLYRMAVAINGQANTKVWHSANPLQVDGQIATKSYGTPGVPDYTEQTLTSQGWRFDPVFGLIFITGQLDRWRVGTSGNLIPVVDSANDIGATTNYARTVYTKAVDLGNSTISSGSGSPEGVLAAKVGSSYVDIATGITWYKRTGTGNTGWSIMPPIPATAAAKQTLSSGDVTCSIVTWAAITASALDITIGHATANPITAGMWVELSLLGFSGSATPGLFFDVATIVSAAPVNYISGLANSDNTFAGVQGWRCGGSTNANLSGTVMYQVQAGDISGGTVLFRPYWVLSTAGTRSVLSNSKAPLIFTARLLG